MDVGWRDENGHNVCLWNIYGPLVERNDGGGGRLGRKEQQNNDDDDDNKQQKEKKEKEKKMLGPKDEKEKGLYSESSLQD